MPTISSRLAATCSDHEFIARFVCIGFSRRSWRAGLAAAIGEMEAPSLWIERCAPIDAGFEEGGLSVPSYLPADDSSLAGQHGTSRQQGSGHLRCVELRFSPVNISLRRKG